MLNRGNEGKSLMFSFEVRINLCRIRTFNYFRSFSTKKSSGEIVSDEKEIEEKAPFNPNPASLASSSVPQSVFEDRTALIYRPARNVMQSGRAQTHKWIIQFNSNVPRWQNPIMGWTSSRDPIQGLSLKFECKEDAIKYAKEQGWAYELKEDEKIPMRPKSYSDNFLYSSKKLKIIKTK